MAPIYLIHTYTPNLGSLVLFFSSRGVAAALSLRVEREYNIPSS